MFFGPIEIVVLKLIGIYCYVGIRMLGGCVQMVTLGFLRWHCNNTRMSLYSPLCVEPFSVRVLCGACFCGFSFIEHVMLRMSC